MALNSIMTTRVISVEMDDTLFHISELLTQAKVHHIPVLSAKKLVGIISDRDVYKNLSPFINTAAEFPRDKATLEKRAHQIMSRNPICILETASVKRASELILAHELSALPVVNKASELVGIISWRDILRFALSNTKK